MIQKSDKVFEIHTKKLSYIIGLRSESCLEQLYFGRRIGVKSASALQEKYASEYGNTILGIEKEHITFDNICVELSSQTLGDYRESSLEMKMPDGSYAYHFLYKDYEIYDGIYKESSSTRMPHAKQNDIEGCQTLEILFREEKYNIELRLVYTAFEDSDVITLRRVLKNDSNEMITLDKFMSMQLDLPEANYEMVTFDGAWTRERHMHRRKLAPGRVVNDSNTGTSSNHHNPLIYLVREGASKDSGECIGLNLIYSGNHYEAVEVSPYQKIRMMTGVNPHRFVYQLAGGDVFYSPEAVLSFSPDGMNSLAQNFHHFVQNHIIAKHWNKNERPVLVNNWEATYFDFQEKKLLKLAKDAKELGIELFVLDDGWFGKRENDHCSLGDWKVNEKKLGGTLDEFANKIETIGLKMGIWMEPEMISPDSDLYRSHPEYAIEVPDRHVFLGRNQLVLDLTQECVQDFMIQSVGNILDCGKISYLKWDMNRQITDGYSRLLEENGEFYHRYVLGLYRVLDTLTKKFPDVLIEGCSAGGNRFDLGMLCYMPQIWTSDDTDAKERICIQEGTSYGYPLCTMGAHVSAIPNHQTLRNIDIETRFHVACFGLLGYELDLSKLNKSECKVLKEQIAFYKKYRKVFQYGTFSTHKMANDNEIWQVVSRDQCTAIAMVYQKESTPNLSNDILRVEGLLDEEGYHVRTRKQALSIKTFGNLVNQVSPIEIAEGGVMQAIVDKVYRMDSEVEEYDVTGDMLAYAGIKLSQRFIGTGYNEKTRVMPDNTSRMYVVEKKK